MTEFVDFSLKALDGRTFDSAAARASAPLVIAFFRTECPTCQLMFPYLQKLADDYAFASVWGVSQNDAYATLRFAGDYGSRFPLLVDEGLVVSDRFGLSHVPTVVLTDKTGGILHSSIGWTRDQMNEVAERIAQVSGVPLAKPVADDDPVVSYKPG